MLVKTLGTLSNKDVEVKDDTNSSGPFSNSPVSKFNCAKKDPEHHNLYWDGELGKVNEGYSPENDSMYIGTVVKDMYMSWYQLPVLSFYGNPIKISLHAHAKDMYGATMDNASFLSFNHANVFW